MLVLLRTAAADRLRDSEIVLRAAEAETRELRSILDTATDGVVVVDRDGLILTFNRSAEALFGYEYHEVARQPFTQLFAPESVPAARDYLDGLTKNGVASVLNDGREVIGRVRQGGLVPLFMTMGRIGVGMPKFCAVLRDITQWKRAEEELLNAKRTAERASSAKSDFLARISHEIRTPLNAIIGFSEVMMQQQFGAIENERYREYIKDIHVSGEHLVSLINDLLDLSKIEAGKLDLVFASVNLNQLVQQCVALMQPQANQQRIIIRSSLSATLPPIVADARSVRQIVLNLLSNSIKFTGAGGQVIISTALTDRAEAVLRVRDTGVGMTDKEIETAMEPFRQLATSTRHGSGGTGLGLPLTKALAEANRASFTINSAVDAGTLVEIKFPGTRVLAE
jgi:PAS domain S-box-containing protein